MTDQQLSALLSQDTYPHLQRIESDIAREWIRRHGAEWDSISFDVNLGEGIVLGPEYDKTTRDQARFLSQKRADFVAQRGPTAAIIEIKRRIDFTSLGQLLGYATLWPLEHPETKDLRLIVIGWNATPDAVEVLHAHGISVETFPNLALTE